MRLILDQGVPRDAASLLRKLGYECTHVGEPGMSRAADQEILAWAAGENATVVTLDADFHAILAVSRATGPSVIRLGSQTSMHRPGWRLLETSSRGFRPNWNMGRW